MEMNINVLSLFKKVKQENAMILPLYHPRRILARVVMAIVWTSISFFALITFSQGPVIRLDVGKNLINAVLFFIWMSESLVILDIMMERFMPINLNNIKQRTISQFILSIIISFIIGIIMYLITDVPKDDIRQQELFTVLMFGLWSLMLTHVANLLYRMILKWLESATAVEELKLEKVEMSRKALADQLNPHFLFNNLSALKSLIMLKQDKQATNFITNFSAIYRYVLQKSDAVTISLQEEIDFIEQYLALHRERLGDGVEMKVNIPENYLMKEIPPLTLQLLIENALKHNTSDEDKVLHIDLNVVDEKLIVVNNKQLKKTSPSTNKGLPNLIHRYGLLCDEKVDIIDSDNYFSVAIPLLDL